jgi:hypothetical protein
VTGSAKNAPPARRMTSRWNCTTACQGAARAQDDVMVRARTQNSLNSIRGGPWSSRGFEHRAPDELNIGPAAGSLMVHSTGVSGLIPKSRLEAPDVDSINSRSCQKPQLQPVSDLGELTVGSRWTWCDVMRTSRAIISRNLRSVCSGPVPSVAQIWLVGFMQYDLAYFDHETCRLESVDNPFQAKVLPMSPVKTVTHVSGNEYCRSYAVSYAYTVAGRYRVQNSSPLAELWVSPDQTAIRVQNREFWS